MKPKREDQRKVWPESKSHEVIRQETGELEILKSRSSSGQSIRFCVPVIHRF